MKLLIMVSVMELVMWLFGSCLMTSIYEWMSPKAVDLTKVAVEVAVVEAVVILKVSATLIFFQWSTHSAPCAVEHYTPRCRGSARVCSLSTEKLVQIIPMHVMIGEIIAGRKEALTVSSIICDRC